MELKLLSLSYRFRLLGALLGFVLLLSACESSNGNPESYYHQVSALTAEMSGSYQVQRYFIGHAEASQRATLGFEVAGTIASIDVDEGATVTAGQVLAHLDSRLLKTQLRVIAAEEEDLAARKKLSELDLQRQYELQAKGLAAQQSIDQLQAELSSLDARLKRQQALLDSTQTQLEKQTLLAPYAGEISWRQGDVGTTVTPSQGIFQLLTLGSREVRVGVPANLLASLAVGDEVVALIGDVTVKAEVMALVSHVDTLTNTATVKIQLPNDISVPDGELVYLSLMETLDKKGFWLPDTALSGGVRGMWNVYALVPSEQGLHRIEARSVELLYMGAGKAYVSGAVADGEQLVANGLHRVVPNLQVRVQAQPAELSLVGVEVQPGE